MLTHNATRPLILLCGLVFVSLVAYPVLLTGQSVNTQLNTTLQDLRGAESAGATPSEMQGLISQMNFVANLKLRLQSLPPEDTQTRAQLSDEINDTLRSVDAQAIQLKTIASQRTLIDHVVTYSSGILGAAICTAAYHFLMQLYARYRMKRTLRMKIIPKSLVNVRDDHL